MKPFGKKYQMCTHCSYMIISIRKSINKLFFCILCNKFLIILMLFKFIYTKQKVTVINNENHRASYSCFVAVSFCLMKDRSMLHGLKQCCTFFISDCVYSQNFVIHNFVGFFFSFFLLLLQISSVLWMIFFF